MNKQTPSPMGEATLWQLYRSLLAQRMLLRRLSKARQLSRLNSGVAAALSENLLDGDTLGLSPHDLVTRYLCGVPLAPLHDAALTRRGRQKSPSWALEADAQHGLLPGAGAEQASLALGTAFSARLHESGGITVLHDESTGPRSSGVPAWAQAFATAVTLQLPLLFISAAPAAAPGGPRKAAALLPSIPVDRNDALALYRVIYESAARARAGGGPTYIECCTWAIEDAPRNRSAPGALEGVEQALKVRKLFDRQRQRHLEHSLERDFNAAGWGPAE